ncbi:MAG TPA: glycosyltransferase family 4 protein [Burkholderiaceae bacterium]|jgi:glycosyltransferase involved in cell wall biosynthesis|nr:glycosyltransferase family 4 protein [Burkholderiaceae bacterium]
MRICFLGWENLSVLAPEFHPEGIGGEQVQHTLLAKALVRRGHQVSMVVHDHGQPDRSCWHGIVTYKAFRPEAGIPVFRYIHPRWTGAWAALERADANVYYASCAGMHVGLLALFCKNKGRKFVFRVAHDTDCEPDKVMIRYWRDRKLYEYGLRHASGIFAQSAKQQRAMLMNYGLQSKVAEMLVDRPEREVKRDIDVLWVNNLRQFKRPDLFLELAKRLPQLSFHMVGGAPPGFDALFESIKQQASKVPNLVFHGHIPYQETGLKYARTRIFVNTSDSEGFPNSYLQAWVRGTPVVAFFDPDGVIRRERLGAAVSSIDQMTDVVRKLAADQAYWSETSKRCKEYMARTHDEDCILAPYLELFEQRT